MNAELVQIAMSPTAGRVLAGHPDTQFIIKMMVEKSLRELLEIHPDIRESLDASEKTSGQAAARMVEIKNDQGDTLFKVFFHWEEDEKSWTAYVQHRLEDWFEKQIYNQQLN